MAGRVTVESTLKVLLDGKKYSTLKDILVTMNVRISPLFLRKSLRRKYRCCLDFYLRSLVLRLLLR